ncbi:Chromosome partition protein Smc [Candidatus Gugararchaeum adminiculabundum]|nr:Chromosome partition protein Smc [Candidatus Gugararchaeum adminiculabundum]
MSEELIKTDVDVIIRALKRSGHMELSQLAKESGLPSRHVEKWTHILEDNGMVRIDYRLTKVYVTWVGSGTLDIEDITRAEERTSKTTPGLGVSISSEEIEEHKKKSEQIKSKASKFEEDMGSVFRRDKVVPKQKEPEKVKEKPREIPAAVTIAKEIAKKKEIPLKAVKAVKPKAVAKAIPVEKEAIEIIEQGLKEVPIEPESIAKAVEKIEKITLKKAGKASSKLAEREKAFMSLSNKLRQKIAEINKKTYEIAEMKKDKTTLFEESYKPVERRFDAEIETIRDILLLKERKIIELQELAVGIPEKVESVEEGVLRLREIEQEAKKVLDDSTVMIEETLNELREVAQEAEGKLENARGRMYSKIEKLDQLDKTIVKVKEVEQSVSQKISESKQRLEEEQRSIEQLEREIVLVREAKNEVEAAMVEVKAIVDTEASRMLDIEDALAKVTKIDKWARENQKQFQGKLQEFMTYVKDSEGEYLRLRESVETGFVRKYLKELREITDAHEFEVNEIAGMEKSIDVKIEESKTELKRLMDESRQLAEKYEGIVRKKEARIDVSKDIAALQEKGEELVDELATIKKKREKLIEEIEDTVEKKEGRE